MLRRDRWKLPYHRAWLVALLILGGAVGILHGNALDQWWLYDDPQILKHAVLYSPADYFFVPSAWRNLIIFSLTPWLTLTFDLDLAVFGFNPGGFYLHNLLTLTLCAWFIFALLQPLIGNLHALAGSLLFLAGTPVVVAAHELMVRHYLEGLLFYLIGLWFFLHALRDRNRVAAFASALAFALAFTAKEIYVPLSLVILTLPVASIRFRLQSALPTILAILIYVAWRGFMLGNLVGGYVPAGDFITQPDFEMVSRFFAVPGLLWTKPALSLIASISVFLAATVRSPFSLRILGLSLFCAALLTLPLFPLALNGDFGADSQRFFLCVWVAVVIAVAWGVSHIPGGHRTRLVVGVILYACIGIPALIKSYKDMSHQRVIQAEYVAQGQQLLELGEDEVLFVSPHISPHYFTGLTDLRPFMGLSVGTSVFVVDESQLVRKEVQCRKILRYDPGSRSVVDITAKIPTLLAKWQQHLRAAPLSVRVDFQPGAQALRWSMGPYSQGSYVYLTDAGAIPIPAKGSIRREKPHTESFRISYHHPEGWMVYSPIMALPSLDANGHALLTWQGSGEVVDILSTTRPACSAIHDSVAGDKSDV